MKNPYAQAQPPAAPESGLQQKARKLADWHQQQARACEHEANLSRSDEQRRQLQQQAQWHRETAHAWQALQDQNPATPASGGFSTKG